MEKKTAQRIIGILIAIALVVILLPLLVDKNDAIATQTSSVKAPPFPDQPKAQAAITDPSASDASDAAVQSSAENTIEITPEIADKVNALSTPSQDPLNPQSAANVTAEANPAVVTPAPAASVAAASVEAPKAAPAAIVAAAPEAMEEEMPQAKPAAAPAVVAAPVIKKAKLAETKTKTVKEKHLKSASKAPAAAKLKANAWVIQLGSFKDKGNASRLADRLRSSGYKAFLKDVKSARSMQTRVFIGPIEQASAAKLSNKLEQQMKLHGFLVKYKPLEL